ncbi:CHAT domain-containing protein [Solicola gregarius]|uniref:CHAT domain-containing protein n=1 Tax=Solicola gregarius TaxID=2908642 RepID=A0AA46TJL8_9ACTN|nr:CHAT domain-containing protein [Solicola gregarius]UYM06564.1 CHAT domain-containing protein [Solicola gregarius]
MSNGLLVQGYDHGDAISALDDFEQLAGPGVSYRARQQVTTRTSAGRDVQQTVELDGDDSDVLEIETANGLVRFTTMERARNDLKGLRSGHLEDLFDARRGDSPIVGVTRSSFTLTDPDIRAAVAELDDALKDAVIGRAGRTLISPVARRAMRRIAEWIDKPVPDEAEASLRRKKAKTPGLYAVDEGLLLEPRQRVEQPLDGGGPVLLLLHGTFSHTEAAFPGLRGTREWSRLSERHAGRAFALEHATLGKTPVQNAVDAAQVLPSGARLQIVSHSRGGLVGEALSLAAAQVAAHIKPDLEAYETAVRRFGVDDRALMAPDIEALPQLRAIVAERELSVERFVRVACPARGTLLASRRLDRYASYLFNLFRLIPGLRATGVVELVKLLLLTFLDQRSDVRAVPGLEAQMPESPFIATINTRAGVVANDRMAAIAGDVEGSGLLKRLKVLGADLYFREDHDMVVNTSAMVEGVPRAEPAVAMFKGAAYSHSNYFTDQIARAAMERWLNAKDLGTVSGFAASLTAPKRAPSRSLTSEGPVGTVVVVPDLFGSKVTVDGQPAWPDPSALTTIGIRDFLDPSRCAWSPTGLVDQYAGLVDALGEHYDVREFAYDCRSPLASAATELNTLLASDGVREPVHLVAHGSGCRIVTLAHDLPGSPIGGLSGRRVLLSPALAGTSSDTARGEGRDALAASLALIDGDDPSVIGALLRDACGAGDGRHPAGVDAPAASWNGYAAVFGRAAYTWTPHPDNPATLALTSDGDGHVALPSAADGRAADGLETHYLRLPFDRLVTDDGAINLVAGLLAGTVGATSPTTAPPHPVEEISAAPTVFPAVFPTADDLVWAGMHAPLPPPRDQTTLDVAIVHGNLASASEKLIVGTQYGTPIGGAEKALDERLDGTLQRHRLLGQYPGPLGTCQLFVRPERPGAGAAVIGIGDPGDLSPGQLTAGVTQAVLRLVAVRATDDEEPEQLELATVLIGTAGLGSMPIASAVGALLTGVRRANRRVRDQGLPHHVASLKIYELYEDRAIEALHAAARLRPDATADEDDVLRIAGVLQEGFEGRPGTPRTNYNADRWRTIRVSGTATDGADSGLRELSFTETGRSAGASTLISRAQHRLIDELVEQCIRTPSVDEQVYNTLYELLVPRSMKGQGRPSEHIMYLLDGAAAALPFEMLATRSFDDGVRPIAIEVGMIRRLETTRIREMIRTSPGRKALVIGDPYAGPGKPRLAAAVREANAVATLLETRGWEVNRLISRDEKDERIDTEAVMNALFAHEYRIIHIAAHGAYDESDPDRSGVCIGPDRFLTTHEFEQMQTTPDLVFLNCCHLGSGIGRPDHLASSVSRKLIDNGIRAVVAAGWAVDDAAAEAFATHFYDGLLSGDNLGATTLNARKRVYDRFGQTTNTWGAYQVYGEPAFQLERYSQTSIATDPTSRRGLREQLETLTQRALFADDADEACIRAELDDARECGAQRGWLQGNEHQAIGEVYRALGDYEGAIGSYNDALRTGGATAGFDIIAQLMGAHTHLGAEHLRIGTEDNQDHFATAQHLLGLWRELSTQSADSEPADPELLKAEANLRQHRLWCRIAERRGDGAANRASRDERSGEPDRDCSEERAAMQRDLTAAWRAFQKASGAFMDGKDRQYTTLAAIVFEWLGAVHEANGGPVDSGRVEEMVKRIRQVRKLAEEAPWSAAPFERLRLADADLALHVVGGTPAAADVAEAYTRVFDKGLSKRERATAMQWIALLHECLPREGDVARQRRQTIQQVEMTVQPWAERTRPPA